MAPTAEVAEDEPYSVRLAEAIGRIDADALPDEVVEKARLALLDFLANAFGAREKPWCRQAVELAVEGTARGGAGTSSIAGHAGKVALDDAVLANAVLGHGLVRDDMHLGAVSHLGAVVMPVALGLAELAPVDGRRFMAAIVAGYEAGGRVGRLILDSEVAKIHRPTGITGPFAAAATAARLLGLDANATACALSLAANTAAGLNQWAASRGDEMYFHPGLAARNGLTAARLTKLGARASLEAIDGPAGLLAAFGKRPGASGAAGAGNRGSDRGPDGAAGDRGGSRSRVAVGGNDGRTAGEDRERLEIESVFFKQVPACNYAQAPAQAARALAERQGPAAGDVERVAVRVSQAAFDYPGCDAAGPLGRELQAKMSIQYNVAAALLTGSFDEAAYEPERNPAVCALARRVELVVDDALTLAYPARQSAEVVVHRRGGRVLAERRDDVEPASPALVRSRFGQAAADALGEHAAARLAAFLEGIESSTNAGDLLLLAVPVEPD